MTGNLAVDDLGLAPVASDVLDRRQADRLARTLDLDEGPRTDEGLPLTWIWAFFSPSAPTSALRPDGHPSPREGSVLDGLDRRMFVGGSLTSHKPLRLDEAVERTSRVIGMEHKVGGSGPFLLVDVEHQYRQGTEVMLVEEQRLMYRTPPEVPVARPGPPTQPVTSTGARLDLCPDERLLFRYSAVTFNTHRIHYDAPYATETEGYPGLVVHGPLTATLLAALAERELAMPLKWFEFRATAPTFVGISMSLVCDGFDDVGALRTRAVRQDGVTVMTARAR